MRVQYVVDLPDEHSADAALQLCETQFADSHHADGTEVLLAGGKISLWIEPDDPATLHIAVRTVTKQTLSTLGLLVLRLSQHFGSTTWTYDD